MKRPWHVERALISGNYDYVTSFATERQAELRARDLRTLWADERYRVWNYDTPTPSEERK